MYPNQYPYQNAAPALPFARQQQYIKDFLKKPLSIILASLFSVSFIVMLISGITAQSAVSTYLPEASGSMAGLFIGLAFYAVLVIGAWLAVIKSMNSDPGSSPSAGLTTMKVFVITLLVLCGLLFLILLIAIIGVAGAKAFGELSQFSYYFESYGIDISTIAESIGLFVAFILLVFALILLYVIALLRMVSSLKKSLKSPLLARGGTGMLAGFSIFLSVCGLISLFSANGLTFNNIMFLATNVCLAVFAISYSSYAKQANAQISAEMNPYPQGYPGAPVPPQPPVYGTPYPQQPVNTQYPSYPQQNYNQPVQQNYATPYPQADVATQAPVAPAQTRYCPACGTQTSDPNQANCSNCGYKF